MQAGSQPPELLAYKALQAVQRGNAEELAKLIQAGANAHVINAVVKTGTSPNGRPDREAKGGLLYHAVEKQNIELVKVLLGNGAEVNGSKQDESPPPLRAAVLIKNVELTSLLLKRGADVNRKYTVSSGPNKVTMTVLFETTSEAVYKLLLRRRGDVKIKDSRGDTPLHVHAAKWNPNFVAALVERGAGVNELDKENRTPLLRAVQQWEFEAGCEEEEDFIEVCHILMTHKAAFSHPDAVASIPTNSDRLLARLQLVEEWEAQRTAGILVLTHLPAEIFRKGAAAIVAYFAAYAPVPIVVQKFESQEEVLPDVPRRQTKTGLAAWTSGEEVLQRQVEILPALDRAPSSRVHLLSSDDVSPFSGHQAPESILPDVGRRPTRTSSTAWIPCEEVINTDQLPSLGAINDIDTVDKVAADSMPTRRADDFPSLLPSFTGPEATLCAKSNTEVVENPIKSASVACEACLGPVASDSQPAVQPIPLLQLYRLKIVCAKGLRRISKYRRQSPYCICRLVRANGETLLQLQTSVHPGGGQVPTWRGQVFELALTREDIQHCTMVFILKHSSVMASLDERIAVGMMPFPNISIGHSITQKLIVMNNDRVAGRLKVFIESY